MCFSFEQPEASKSERELAWEQKLREVEGFVDASGRGMDEGIKETVAALNLLGLETSASCEGDVDEGIPVPWVRVEAPNEPTERFSGENEAFVLVARKYGVPVESVKRGEVMDYYWEAVRACVDNGETEEFLEWRGKNQRLMQKTSGFLEEFYQDRDVPSNIRLIIDELPRGGFEIHNGGEDFRPNKEEALSREEKDALAQRLAQYQEEMRQFTRFVREKYLQGEEYL